MAKKDVKTLPANADVSEAYENRVVETSLPAAGGYGSYDKWPHPSVDAHYRKLLLTKLLAVAAAVPFVEKRGENEKQDYTYVRATDIVALFRDKLFERGVLLTSDVVDLRTWEAQGRNQTLNGVHLLIRFTFEDAETGYSLSMMGAGSGLDTGDKAIYKAQTGALKYILRNTFLVPDVDTDPEADETVDEEMNGSVRRSKRADPVLNTEDGDYITKAQRDRLWAIARSAFPDAGEDEVNKIIRDAIGHHNLEHTSDITRDIYDDICDRVGGDKLKIKSNGRKRK